MGSAIRRILAATLGLGLGLGLAAAVAAASPTGGSMGGGSFGGGGGGGGGGGYSGGGGGYSSGGGGYSSGGGGGHSSGNPAAPAAMFLLFLFGGFIWVASQGFKARSGSSGASSRADADVTVLHVGLDARARPFVQRELARIAGIADTSTAEGRITMLREVALLLRRLRSSWLYGGAYNAPMQSMSGADSTFHEHVDDARSKFEHELVRNEQGKITRADAPTLVTTSDDGPGIMLVTIVAAASVELFTVGQIGDGEDLRRALEALSHLTAGNLIAVEIVWMPAADDDHLSSVALEAAYPPPALFELEGVVAGKVFCGYCGCPYPAEALSCPNCGGRAEAA